MKDVRAEALDQGMAEAGKQAARQVKAGRLSEGQGAAVLAAVRPQLDERDIGWSR